MVLERGEETARVRVTQALALPMVILTWRPSTSALLEFRGGHAVQVLYGVQRLSVRGRGIWRGARLASITYVKCQSCPLRAITLCFCYWAAPFKQVLKVACSVDVQFTGYTP